MKPTSISRRSFFRSTARSAAVLAASGGLPDWFLAECEAAPARPKLGPNDQPVVALVGCGGQGRGDARGAARFGRIVAVCDVDANNLAAARKDHPDARTYSDFREVMARDDIHAVVCGTVDHWHALISLAAMRSGKDVYCEKPLTLTIEEGQRLVKMAKRTGRILQTGSQQRSDRSFRLACELVRNGRIGKLQHVDVWLPAGLRAGPFATAQPPTGLNWDFWQGQTPAVPYVKERCHVNFRFWYEYSGGTMTDWGAHHNDIALWGIGLEEKANGPVSIEGKPLTDTISGGYSAFSDYVVNFTYANGVTQTTRSTTADTIFGGVAKPEGQRNGVKFIGSEGWIWVTRGNLQASKPEIIETALPGNAIRLEQSDNHMANFFDGVRSRKPAICRPEVGHRSASLCHLAVISLRLGRKLEWDPVREKFVGDKQANGWIAREQRKPWTYDLIG